MINRSTLAALVRNTEPARTKALEKKALRIVRRCEKEASKGETAWVVTDLTECKLVSSCIEVLRKKHGLTVLEYRLTLGAAYVLAWGPLLRGRSHRS